MHGMGVSTPIAAAVAAATVGLDGLLHIPNGVILTIGIWSMMLASAWEDMTRAAGSTLRTDGAAPKEQLIAAPPHTQNGMALTSYMISLSSSFLPSFR